MPNTHVHCSFQGLFDCSKLNLSNTAQNTQRIMHESPAHHHLASRPLRTSMPHPLLTRRHSPRLGRRYAGQVGGPGGGEELIDRGVLSLTYGTKCAPHCRGELRARGAVGDQGLLKAPLRRAGVKQV